MSGGYQVNADTLQEAAQGINDTMTALKSVTNVEEAESGRGFSDLALNEGEIGTASAQKAFAEFCERWSWGVRTLVQDGNQIAWNLGLSAGYYYDAEQYAVGALKDVVNAENIFTGDPHASEETVENESFGQAASAVMDNHDKSWGDVGKDAAETWKGVGRDAVENGLPGMPLSVGQIAGMTGQSQKLTDVANDMFGPPPAPSQDQSAYDLSDPSAQSSGSSSVPSAQETPKVMSRP